MLVVTSHRGGHLTTQDWLPLNEYSLKHKISLSTLRRRIRASTIEFQFNDGKYWIKESTHNGQPTSVSAEQSPQQNPQGEHNSEEFLASAKNLMQEIKSAYITVLQAKESQIMELKEELADLKTLVKILEAENARLKPEVVEPQKFEDWLERSF